MPQFYKVAFLLFRIKDVSALCFFISDLLGKIHNKKLTTQLSRQIQCLCTITLAYIFGQKHSITTVTKLQPPINMEVSLFSIESTAVHLSLRKLSTG